MMWAAPLVSLLQEPLQIDSYSNVMFTNNLFKERRVTLNGCHFSSTAHLLIPNAQVIVEVSINVPQGAFPLIGA